jgi:hypothetical protein
MSRRVVVYRNATSREMGRPKKLKFQVGFFWQNLALGGLDSTSHQEGLARLARSQNSELFSDKLACFLGG